MVSPDFLFSQLKKYITDPRVLDLLWRYMRRTIYDGGLYEDVMKGISLGCPLSPLMGALYLKPLDDAMGVSGLPYARFMDDWVILSSTRWKLRRAIGRINAILAELKVQQHPDKTFVGRVSRGFDFLGFTFSAVGLTGVLLCEVLPPTVSRWELRSTSCQKDGRKVRRTCNPAL